MAKTTGFGQQLYVDGYDLSGDTGSLGSVSTPRTTLDATGINKSAMERIIGRTDGNLEFTAYFNDAAGQQHAMMSQLTRSDVVAIYAQGESVGDTAAGVQVKQATYDLARSADGGLQATCQLTASGTPVEWGEMLSGGKDTHGSASSSSSKDDSSSSANGISAFLNLFDLDSGAVTLIIQESSDNGSGDAWATKASFSATAAAAAPTGEHISATGTVERYLRVTSTGTFSNADFAICYRRGGANDVPGLIV